MSIVWMALWALIPVLMGCVIGYLLGCYARNREITDAYKRGIDAGRRGDGV